MKQINKYGESFTITPYLVQRILKTAQGFGWKWIIAPYEADAQLAYLFHSGKADFVITEDSDLIAYGVTKLVYRLDNDADGYELDMNWLFHDGNDFSDKLRSNSQECSQTSDTREKIIVVSDNSFTSQDDGSQSVKSQEESKNSFFEKTPIFSKENFLATWILAGCDYLEPIKGIGFKTAHKLMQDHQDVEKTLRAIKHACRYTIPENYLEQYHQAYMTFLFQIVYDYEKEICWNLQEPSNDDFYGKMFLASKEKDFWGQMITPETAKSIWEGDLDYSTGQPIDMDKLFIEFKNTNDPFTTSNNSESDECQIIEQVYELENKPVLKKKPLSVQKKMWFNTISKKRNRVKMPSPYKTKIACGIMDLEVSKSMKKGSKSIRKRTYKQLSLLDKANQQDSDMDEDYHDNSLMGLFKRAKKQDETILDWHGVVKPKLQTIKKKTFMRSLSSAKFDFKN